MGKGIYRIEFMDQQAPLIVRVGVDVNDVLIVKEGWLVIEGTSEVIAYPPHRIKRMTFTAAT